MGIFGKRKREGQNCTELNETFSLINDVQQAFGKYDQERQERIERGEYYCWNCGSMQSEGNPCRHHR
ncbi:hypothetical protein ccbrp13_56510 [Ktedonobacteria bacterium brp13]|nr:hypothetical protein ccbrp13_56510 [Ktedonobacteria bacterium brp13]